MKIVKYFACALALLLLMVGFYKFPILVLKNKQNEILLFAPLQEKGEFCIRFTHSVALSPVDECFSVQDEKIILTHTIYEDFGAGLPHNASTAQDMSFEDGKIIISGYDLAIPNLQVRVGRIAKHKLLLPTSYFNKETRLDTLAEPGASITMLAEYNSLLGLLNKFGINVFNLMYI